MSGDLKKRICGIVASAIFVSTGAFADECFDLRKKRAELKNVDTAMKVGLKLVDDYYKAHIQSSEGARVPGDANPDEVYKILYKQFLDTFMENYQKYLMIENEMKNKGCK